MDYDKYRSKGKAAGGIKAKNEVEVKIKDLPGLILARAVILHLGSQNQLAHEIQNSIPDISNNWKCTNYTEEG